MRRDGKSMTKDDQSELTRLKKEMGQYKENILDLEAEIRRLKKKIDELENRVK